MSAKKTVSPRSQRRAASRAGGKLTDARERLAALEAGGTARRPIDVASSSQIEVQALSLGCLRCDGTYRLEEHAAQSIGGARLRVVRMTCAACGAKRTVYFRIVEALPRPN